jgi:hypothetical protein
MALLYCFVVHQDNFLTLTQGEFMTKKLKIAAAVLLPLMALGGFKFYQFYDETLYHIKDTNLPNAPLSTKIDLSKKGVTQFDFEVDHNNTYIFALKLFFKNEKERALVGEIVGDSDGNRKGDALPIRFTLTKQYSTKPIFQRQAELRPNTSYNSRHISISLLGNSSYSRIELEPGKYTVLLEVLTDSPAYKNLHSELTVDMDAKWYFFYQEIVR